MSFFSRQKIISNWNQDALNKEVLIIGVGGMGCHLAVSCCRLGIKKILLIDDDNIEPSNLNRQILYNKNDIGKRKVEVAKTQLDNFHSINTTIEALDMNIFKKWNEFVPLVRDSDFVLNGLDCPEVKRVAVASLCLKFDKPMVYAGTDIISGNAGMVLFQGERGQPCYECLQASLPSIDPKYHHMFHPENIYKHATIPIDEISGKKEEPTAASTNYTAAIVSNLAINLMIHYFLKWSVVPNRVIVDLYNYSIESWKVRESKNCPICGTKKLDDETLKEK